MTELSFIASKPAPTGDWLTQKILQGGEIVSLVNALVFAPPQHPRKPHRNPALVALGQGDPLKPQFKHQARFYTAHRAECLTVVLRTMLSTWRISSSVSPEYALANGTSVRSLAPGGLSHTANV